MNLSGRQVTAGEALALGLADKVVPAEELVEVATADAARWAAGPTKAHGAVKRAMGEGHGQPIDRAMAVERTEFDLVFGTEDARTGILAFVAKERPEFTGR
jgi:2-(1,2-epoxy-1,2-dihydrophenyl)acetyl-CoA isomerase